MKSRHTYRQEGQRGQEGDETFCEIQELEVKILCGEKFEHQNW
jgi:hypothetical protein